jgi:cytoskeletal protein RodZ
MAVAINLLKNRHTLSEAEYQKERKYYSYTVMLAVFAVVVTVAVSVWQFVLTRQFNSLEKSIAKSAQELVGLSQANAKQIYLKSRLKLITSFLDERSIARQSLQRVFSLAIPGVSIHGANFESDSVLNVQLVADDILALTELTNYFETDNEFFLQVVNRGITRQQDGKYQMDVSLTIPKG